MRVLTGIAVTLLLGLLTFGWVDARTPAPVVRLQPVRTTTGTDTVRSSYITPNTVRVMGTTPYAMAAAITQLTYGATHHEDRPHAVTLVRADRQADAMLAAARITHFPVNAPLLYVDADRIPPETMAELRRLAPDGNTYDHKVQVYLVGPIHERVERFVRDSLGYAARAFRIADPIALSEALDTWAAAVHADHPDAVAIVQYTQLSTGLPVIAWDAHMGDGLAFVVGDSIPPATRQLLARRFNREAYIYVMGDTTVISARVARALARYGVVQRIPGATPTDISVAFAGFRDAGLNQGRWIGWSSRDFGWGIAEAGHNYAFVNAQDWQTAVAGALLSHMGKHGPMLLLPDGVLDSTIVRYLRLVRPSAGAPNDQLLNHGWILGRLEAVNWFTQGEIDAFLEPERP